MGFGVRAAAPGSFRGFAAFASLSQSLHDCWPAPQPNHPSMSPEQTCERFRVQGSGFRVSGLGFGV